MPDLLSFFGEIALRSSLVLGGAFVCLLAMRQASASERHLVLLLAVLMTAVVPAGLLLSPKITWTIPLSHQGETGPSPQSMTAHVLPENENSSVVNSTSVLESKPSITDYCTATNGLIAFLAGGMLMQVAVLGRAVWEWRRIRRHAEKALLPDAVLEPARAFTGARTIPPIFTSDQISVPLLSGWLRPAIILPADSIKWPSKRLLMALCHELAHFRRGDSLLLPLICTLRVFYWWHPLVWLALARLRRERENACDDLVLNQDVRATDYADLIVSTARQAQALRWQDGALAMASSSNVGERIRAILNPKLNRRQASRTTVFIGLIFTFTLGWFFVAAQVKAEDAAATPHSITATDASKPQIEIAVKLVEINETTYLSHQKGIDAAVAKSDLVSLINIVNNLPGASLLSAPSVTTQNGFKANIEIVREMPYATKFDKDKDGKIVPSDFKTQDVGVSVEALPTLQADKQSVRLKFSCKLTDFEGWKEIPSRGREPVFGTVSIEAMERIINKQGLAVWVGGPRTTHVYLPEKDGNTEPYTADTLPKRMLLLINARPVPAEPQTPSVPSKAMVKISLKYFQISEKTYSQQTATVADGLAMTDALNRGDISYFSRLPDFALLTEPSVLTKMGEQGALQVVNKMSYPVKLIRDSTGKFIPSGTMTDRLIGMKCGVQPELLANGTISLSYFDEITNFKGMINYGGPDERYPVFNTTRAVRQIKLSAGKPFGTWVRTNFEDQSKLTSWQAGDPPSTGLPDAPKVRIAMVITANLYSGDGSPMPTH